jgi:hypothetical protein
MPLTKIQSLGITDGTIVAGDIASGAITAAKLASGVGGKVLQVVTATYTGGTISSTSDVTTNLTASITPSSASNKILILITSVIAQIATSRGNDFCGVNLKRGATSILGGGNNDFASVYQLSTHTFYRPIAISYVDSPNTTSSTTYELFSRVETAGEVVYWHQGIGGRITLMEIAP